MPEGTAKDVVDKFTLFKKAGASPIVVILLMVMTTPGFFGLFDKSADQAQTQANAAEKKADIAYEVLAAEIKELRRDNQQNEARIQNQNGVIMLLLQKGVGVEGPSEVDIINEIVNTPVHRTAPPVSRRRTGRGSGSVAKPETAPMAELVPPEMLEDLAEQNEMPPQEQREALPKSLDALMK